MNNLSNHVQLIGRVGVEPNLRTLDNGDRVLGLSLATNERYKDKEGKQQERTEWHRLTAWNKTADLMAKLIKKGDQIAIEGKLTHRSYEKDGETRYVTEVVINEFVLFGTKS